MSDQVMEEKQRQSSVGLVFGLMFLAGVGINEIKKEFNTAAPTAAAQTASCDNNADAKTAGAKCPTKKLVRF